MKKHFLIPLTLLIFSCGGSEESDSTDDIENDENTEVPEVVEEDEALLDGAIGTPSNYQPENEDGLWQIDDYAEKMVGDEIFNSYDEAPSDHAGSINYYQTLDLKGGFASVTGAYEGWSEYVLWRMSDGRDLLGTMSAGCGPVCSYSFHFYRCKEGEITEIDLEEIFPLEDMAIHRDEMYEKAVNKYDWLEYPNDYQYIFKLPQKGTSMNVDLLIGADEIQFQIFEMSWNKMSFDIAEQLYDIPDTE